MNTAKISLLTSPFIHFERSNQNQEKLLSYYENAGPDYETWSRNFNMHFGFYKRGTNPFNREQMLEQMNAVVLGKLNIKKGKPSLLVDMGCGLAATMRHACQDLSELYCKGVTIVPWQKRQADVLNIKAGFQDRIQVLIEDYSKTSFRSNSVDHVIAMESSCYAEGATKVDLLKEIHRVLKPGGTFVIADGFLKSKAKKGWLLKKAYDQLCRSWALKELGNIHDVKSILTEIGFKDVQAEDISWKVAPSVAHVPFTVVSFLVKEWLFGKKRMNKERWDNLKSPLLTMILGLHQKHFGYYLVSGVKPK